MLFTEQQLLTYLNIYFSRPISSWAETRKSVQEYITKFIESVKENNAIHNFVIICDERNNPPDKVVAGQIIADIWIQEKKENMWEHLPLVF